MSFDENDPKRLAEAERRFKKLTGKGLPSLFSWQALRTLYRSFIEGPEARAHRLLGE
ncbi:hypothetical protein ACVWWG_000015 [Bradyrhizobium sp. LB7.2]